MSNLSTIFGGMVVFALLAAALPALGQRHSNAPVYRPPPPPPPVYRAPPPPANQNMRSGTSGTPTNNNVYGAPRSGGLSTQGTYRPGSIANPGARAGGTSGQGGWGDKGLGGPSTTTPALANRSGALGTAAQPGAAGFGKDAASNKALAKGPGAGAFSKPPAAANDNVAKSAALPKAALATGAGAGLFAKAQAGDGGTKASAGSGGGGKKNGKWGDTSKPTERDKTPCTPAMALSNPRCKFNCASLVPKPSYCPDDGTDGAGGQTAVKKQDKPAIDLKPPFVFKPSGN